MTTIAPNPSSWNMPRFRNLPPAQDDAFSEIASGWSGGHDKHPRTMKALERKGLVVGHDVEEVERGTGLTFKYRTYEVPIPVHIEWCDWCAKHYPFDDRDRLPQHALHSDARWTLEWSGEEWAWTWFEHADIGEAFVILMPGTEESRPSLEDLRRYLGV